MQSQWKEAITHKFWNCIDLSENFVRILRLFVSASRLYRDEKKKGKMEGNSFWCVLKVIRCWAEHKHTGMVGASVAHLCCSSCLPPLEGSRAGLPGWQRYACAGSWWSAGWRRPCPAGWWWPQAKATFWPAQRTQNSPSPGVNEPHCETSLYAGSGDWKRDQGEGVLRVEKTWQKMVR